MRTIFITGFGEEEWIFDRIKEGLPGDKLVLSLWKELPQGSMRGLRVTDFAHTLAARYDITKHDLVIGHSTGGWVALFIKQVAGCPIIQLASWTDPLKVIVPVRNRLLIYVVAWSGLYLNRLALRSSIKKHYAGKASRPVFERIFQRLVAGNRANMINQLRLIFNPVSSPAASPDLRIHAKEDPIIRYPDEPVQEVPGDHFILYTHPETVLAPILAFIQHHLTDLNKTT